MQKILFIITCMLVGTIHINASEWSTWSTKYPEKNNITIETETRYKWFINRKVDLGYMDVENNCEYFDKNDFKEVVNFTIELPDEKQNRIIEPFEKYENKNINYAGTIHFFNFTINENVQLTEIEIFNNKEKIKFEIVDRTYFNGSDLSMLMDGLKDKYIPFQNYDKLSLGLGKIYNLENIILRLYFNKPSSKFEIITLAIGHSKYEYISMGEFKNVEEHIICENNICYVDIDVKKYIGDTRFEDYIFGYKYTDTLYKCYKNSKEYLDGYYSFIENYQKDENSAVTYYRYKENENKDIIKEIENIKKQKISYVKMDYDSDNQIVEKEENNDNQLALQTEIKETIENNDLKIYQVLIITSLIIFLVTITYIVYKKCRKK